MVLREELSPLVQFPGTADLGTNMAPRATFLVHSVPANVATAQLRYGRASASSGLAVARRPSGEALSPSLTEVTLGR